MEACASYKTDGVRILEVGGWFVLEGDIDTEEDRQRAFDRVPFRGGARKIVDRLRLRGSGSGAVVEG